MRGGVICLLWGLLQYVWCYERCSLHILKLEVRSRSLKLHYPLLQRTPARRRGYRLKAIVDLSLQDSWEAARALGILTYGCRPLVCLPQFATKLWSWICNTLDKSGKLCVFMAVISLGHTGPPDFQGQSRSQMLFPPWLLSVIFFTPSILHWLLFRHKKIMSLLSS